jgi:cytochrome c peroxidase
MKWTGRRGLALVCGSLLWLSVGCERASRYPAEPKFAVAAPESGTKKNQLIVPPYLGWLPTKVQDNDIPIVFVHSSQAKEWQELPEFWNHVPPPVLGKRTMHLGQSPLGAVASLFAGDETDRRRVIKIRVPLGLADPTATVPEANPMTYLRWRLGKQLFFDRRWLTADGNRSCATCHDAESGFTERAPPRGEPWMKAPSLINCAFNKHQFWDGRVRYLEEVLQRQLEEEEGPAPLEPGGGTAEKKHSWGGIVARLSQQPDLVQGFEAAFGIDMPTVDATAKALAVYLRTILSGNSLYDQARRNARADGKAPPQAKDFEPLLTEPILRALGRDKGDKKKVAVELAAGADLFFAKRTRCVACHTGWNFIDNSFHNVSIRESTDLQEPGKENGHFARLPFGRKDPRMRGAFKTPSLRNLPQTYPYFHDGHCRTLEQVVQHYNKGIHNRYYGNLDPVLKDGPNNVLELDLSDADVNVLALFLRSLNGEPVPSVIAAPLGPRE